MVASNTLQRYPETFDLAASAVNGALRGATVEGVDLFAKASCVLLCAGVLGLALGIHNLNLHPTTLSLFFFYFFQSYH